MTPFHYKYNVITRADRGLRVNDDLWLREPGMTYLVRTNVRMSKDSKQWVSGMGRTVEEAVRSAEMGLALFYGQRTYIGELTDRPIKNEEPKQ